MAQEIEAKIYAAEGIDPNGVAPLDADQDVAPEMPLEEEVLA